MRRLWVLLSAGRAYRRNNGESRAVGPPCISALAAATFSRYDLCFAVG